MGLLQVQTASRKRWLTATGLLIIFTALATSVKLHLAWVSSLDQGVAGWLTGWENSSRTAGFIMISKFGSPLIATIGAVILMLWLWWKRERLASGISFLIYFGGNALALAIKYLVGRVRPIHELFADSGFSFPSGHVFSSTLLILLLLLVLNHYLEFGGQLLASIAAIVWVMALMVARVYLRNHYSTDVLGSVLLASGWVMAGQLICSALIARLPRLARLQGDD